ncbi:type VI secretion system ImpA family N-terminal domain-containing protein [Rhizobium sp. CSW-27]|uniref:type VI secretion system protein TssA n=1 Tax=Rhizobium sp. CSW-27 TaxID=2839985 RepID=UPI001C0107D2|nr:type VI secretion system ImpA family N-terminal domain-containing protein [Rhizobium sp. CSW-27]MBT9373078.1 type VI secretion system ImpA family N-terminal domain-containing protein [Rhizobium sp. CSW-27]
MELSSFLLPVSSDFACGPDLDASGDAEYFNYVIAAESRLPERFVDLTTGKVFDRSVIDLEREDEEIVALLDRSRDLRLAVLRAQFHAVAGTLSGFTDCVELIERLLATFWLEVHPQPDGDGGSFRRQVLEGLNDRSKVLMPLTYSVLLKDRRVGYVSLRTGQLVQKPEMASAGETVIEPPALKEVLSSSEHQASVIETFRCVERCIGLLDAIRSRFINEGDLEHVPVMAPLVAVLEAIGKMLADHVPAGTASDQSGTASIEDDVPAVSAEAAVPSLPKASMSSEAFPIASHREAKAALSALEDYFAENEPSSPALILVHQAKRLIGRPLVEALAALAPARVGSAMLLVDEAAGFSFDMERMQQLTVPITHEDGGILKRFSSGDPVIRNREKAIGAMMGVEVFLRQREPSSPVPLLLSRARSLMAHDFSEILREMFKNKN